VKRVQGHPEVPVPARLDPPFLVKTVKTALFLSFLVKTVNNVTVLRGSWAQEGLLLANSETGDGEAYREVYTLLYHGREAYREVYTLLYTSWETYRRFTPILHTLGGI